MRFLQIVTSTNDMNVAPRDPAHIDKMRKSIGDEIASGAMLATGGLGKRATSAARVTRRAGQITVEDPPTGDGWMAGGGFSLLEYASKEEAIERAKQKLELMGEGICELIQVSEMHPPSRPTVQSTAAPAQTAGVIPYLTLEGANEASLFYQRAFGAKEIARMPAADGKRLMHCHLEINGGAFMLSDHFPEHHMGGVQRSDSYTMQLIVSDGDAWWKRALTAGCKQKLPFEVAPWGDKYGQLVDPFGVTWALNMPAHKGP